MNVKHLYLSCFLITLGIISYGDLRYCQKLPWPPRFIATGIVFGMLDLASGVIGDAAPLIGVGIVVAFLVNPHVIHPDCSAEQATSTTPPSQYQTIPNAPLPPAQQPAPPTSQPAPPKSSPASAPIMQPPPGYVPTPGALPA